MRISAKKLRYTLEAFEEALGPAASLIKSVIALQDAAGEMHDAIVARDRADSFLKAGGLADHQRRATTGFIGLQDRRAQGTRVIIARRLATIRGRSFRASLDRAVIGMETPRMEPSARAG
jgi:CHAD domain-containing protein